LETFVSHLSRFLLAAALVLCAGLIAVPAAGARVGSCLVPGSSLECNVWTGKVTFIADGDTIYVDIDGDGTRTAKHVRVTGVNAMEQSVYPSQASQRRGECHAVEATARLEQLIKRSKGRVRLAAQDPGSHSGSRLRRLVAVRQNGRWRDIGRRLLAEGHALWLANRAESAWNREYSVLAQRAATTGRGIWNPHYCGVGPHESSPIGIYVHSNADGSDADFVNGEWVRIRNLDPVNAVSLGGWWVRDSALRRYTFPSYTTIAPNDEITVYAGEGTDTWTEFYWGLRRPAFENATFGEDAMGDGAYLFDPQGDLRTWMIYPCRRECAAPHQGLIQIDAKYSGREHITLRNNAPTPIDLSTYRLDANPYSYAFDRDSVLQPGEEMRIDVRGDPAENTRLEKHWGETGAILRNTGDTVRLASYTEITLGCYAWGDKAC
jgi:endonuclease YncB( thermonuclease family)